MGIVICEKGGKVNGKFHQSSLGQGFDIRNAASRGKIRGNAKRTWESAVEKKEWKVINILYICLNFLQEVGRLQKVFEEIIYLI